MLDKFNTAAIITYTVLGLSILAMLAVKLFIFLFLGA